MTLRNKRHSRKKSPKKRMPKNKSIHIIEQWVWWAIGTWVKGEYRKDSNSFLEIREMTEIFTETTDIHVVSANKMNALNNIIIDLMISKRETPWKHELNVINILNFSLCGCWWLSATHKCLKTFTLLFAIKIYLHHFSFFPFFLQPSPYTPRFGLKIMVSIYFICCDICNICIFICNIFN